MNRCRSHWLEEPIWQWRLLINQLISIENNSSHSRPPHLQSVINSLSWCPTYPITRFPSGSIRFTGVCKIPSKDKQLCMIDRASIIRRIKIDAIGGNCDGCQRRSLKSGLVEVLCDCQCLKDKVQIGKGSRGRSIRRRHYGAIGKVRCVNCDP